MIVAKINSFKKYIPLLLVLLFGLSVEAFARDVNYTGGEQVIYVKPGEPTQITFPGSIEGGFRPSNSNLNLDRKENFLIIFAQPQLPLEGEALIVHLADKRTYALRVVPANLDHPRDDFIMVLDDRPPELEEESPEEQGVPKDFAPPTVVSGLMREMILVAEFGKRKGVVGYRRSNQYSGETVLHDGTIKATIDEIYMGPNLWGYVLNVENLLETTQRINPTTFRMDGTRAVSASNWELAPKPLTAEQQIVNKHLSKVYVITRAKRR